MSSCIGGMVAINKTLVYNDATSELSCDGKNIKLSPQKKCALWDPDTNQCFKGKLNGNTCVKSFDLGQFVLLTTTGISFIAIIVLTVLGFKNK